MNHLKSVFTCQAHKVKPIPEIYIYHKNEKGKFPKSRVALIEKLYRNKCLSLQLSQYYLIEHRSIMVLARISHEHDSD